MRTLSISIVLLFLLSALPDMKGSAPFDSLFLKRGYLLLGRDLPVGEYHESRKADTLTSVYSMMNVQFDTLRNNSFHYGHTAQSYWFHFSLKDSVDRELILEIDNPYLYEVWFYLVRANGKVDTIGTGTRLPFDTLVTRNPLDTTRNSRNFQFPIKLKAGRTVQCFLNIPQHKLELDFKMYLFDKETRVSTEKLELTVLVVFFSLIFTYLLILGIAIYLTRFQYYWYYFGYVVLGALFVFSDMGLGFQFLWRQWPYLQQVAVPVIANLYLIMGTLFVRELFQTQSNYPKLDEWFKIMMIAACFLILPTLATPFLPTVYAHLLSFFHNSLYIIVTVLFFVLVHKAFNRSERYFPGWFLVGFLLHGVNVIFSSLQAVKVNFDSPLPLFLEKNGIVLCFHTSLFLMLGMLFEMGIILYIGMKRFKLMYAEKQRMSEDLASQKQLSMNALVMGIEGEQRRISMELHDNLGGSLSALKVKLETLKADLEKKGQANGLLNEAVKGAETMHQELREISHNLMPSSLHKLGFLPAVEQRIHQMQAIDSRLKIKLLNYVDFQGATELAKVYLFRIVQELLHNVFRHSQATTAYLQFVQQDENLVISMEDNGVGFDVKQVRKEKKGMGLSNLKYRTEDGMGGKFQVESSPGKGAFFSIEVPLAFVFGKKSEGNEN